MYLCVKTGCGKGFPRLVNFCPYCGTRQPGAAVPAVAPTSAPTAAPTFAPTVAPTPAPTAAPTAPPTTAPTAAPTLAPYVAVAGVAAVSGPAALSEAEQLALERLNRLRGQPAAAAAAGAGAAASSPSPSRPQPGQASPALRKPIGKSAWLTVALLLALIWFLARPTDPFKKLEPRVEQAVALAEDCKVELARVAQTGLKADKASVDQLKRVHDAINANAAVCEKKRLRSKAWKELLPTLESALQSGAVERADSRLAGFTKKWGADDDTREWDAKIDDRKGERLLDEADACLKRSDHSCLEAKLQAAEKLQRDPLKPRIQLLREALERLLKSKVLEESAAEPAAPPPRPAPTAAVTPPVRQTVPAAAPSAAPKISPAVMPAVTPAVTPPVAQQNPQAGQQAQQAQQARQLLADAQRELSHGNYRGAMDKAEICATMIDTGNRECTALKNKAERLNRDMLRCVSGGKEWVGDLCQ